MTSGTRSSEASQLAPGLVPAEAEAGGVAAGDHRIGELLDGRYRLLERLAAGGMGTVYRAEHLALRKEVAIKFVQDGENPDHALRFLREAMLTSRIDHPNVISALDYSTFDQGAAYLVMSLVEGPTLANAMRVCGPMPWLRAAQIGAQIADAVAAAHAQGIVHRDLKPENVVLQPMPDGSEAVKLLDFGLAKYARDSLAPPQVQGAQRVTRRGVVVGTPGYMAPEQAVGMRADHRVDLYALGVLLWECVAGRRLWDSDDIQQLLTTQLTHHPRSLREERNDATIPEAFDAVVTELLAARPERRAGNAAEIRERLRALVEAERREPTANAELTSGQLASAPLPPNTDTVFIHDAIVGLRAGPRPPAAEAKPSSGTRETTTQVQAAVEYGDGLPPTKELSPFVAQQLAAQLPTQVGFRAARALQNDASVQARESATSSDPLVAESASMPAAVLVPVVAPASAPASAPALAAESLSTPALAPAVEPADGIAAYPLAKRAYVAVAAALALLSIALWAAFATDSPAPRSAVAAHVQRKPALASRVAARSDARQALPGPSSPATAAATKPRAVQPAHAPTARNAARAKSRPAPVARTPAAKKPDGPSALATANTNTSPIANAEPQDPGALRAAARAHFRSADFALAAQTYRQAIKAAPGHAGAYAGLGASQLAVGDTRAAIASYKQAIQRSPGTSGFHAALGRAYMLLPDRERAIAEYRKAVALDPANEVAAAALARLAL